MRYRILRNVNIRANVPRITATNRVGTFYAGQVVDVLNVQVTDDKSTWGAITQPDAKGNANWICIANKYGEKFAALLDDIQPAPPAAGVEERIAALEARVAKLEAK
jgi:hypothetical protein